MKKIISFNDGVAILERSKTAATLEVRAANITGPLPMSLAQIADAINEAENIDVHLILPSRGKIAFTASKGMSNTELLDTICDAIAGVLDTDTVVSNERAETII